MQLFLYQPGASWLHRHSAGTKLALLLPLSLGLFVIESPAWLLGGLLLSLGVLASTGLSPKRWIAALRWPALAVAVISVLNVLWLGPAHATVIALRLGAALLLACAFTASTPISAVLETVEGTLLPLERRGWLHAQKVAFTLSLALTLVPVIFEQLRQAREAQLARGAGGDLRALLTPVIVRVMKAADELTLAVESRGFPRPSLAPRRDARGPGA